MRASIPLAASLLLAGASAGAQVSGTAPAPAPAAPATAPAPAAAASPAPAAPAAAPAARLRVAVVALDAPKDLALLGRSLGEAIAQEAAKGTNLEVIGPGDVIQRIGPEAAAALSRCGDSAGCYGGPSAGLGVDRVVGGFVERAGDDYRFGLVHVDLKGPTAVAKAGRQVPIASRRIRQDVVAAAGPLLRGEAEATGTLRIVTEDPGAEVKIDGRPAGRTPFEARVPAGKHKVEVAQRGKVRVEPFWVDVPANGKAEPEVRLHRLPLSERKPGEVETNVDVGRDRDRSRKH